MLSEVDDIPVLSAHATAALNEFLAEQQEKSQGTGPTNKPVAEDWQLSQFWYDDETAKILAEECLNSCSPDRRIACVSCPTAFFEVVKRAEGCAAKVDDIILLEFDRRFEKTVLCEGNFVYYDYSKPLELPKRYQNFFDFVMLDPPFLSLECLEKCQKTVEFLSSSPDTKVLVCTGQVMEEHVERLFGAKCCKFIPKHKNNLANEFRCYSNYDCAI